MEVDLKNLLPEWFKGVLDFRELMDTESIELEKLENMKEKDMLEKRYQKFREMGRMS